MHVNRSHRKKGKDSWGKKHHEVDRTKLGALWVVVGLLACLVVCTAEPVKFNPFDAKREHSSCGCKEGDHNCKKEDVEIKVPCRRVERIERTICPDFTKLDAHSRDCPTGGVVIECHEGHKSSDEDDDDDRLHRIVICNGANGAPANCTSTPLPITSPSCAGRGGLQFNCNGHPAGVLCNGEAGRAGSNATCSSCRNTTVCPATREVPGSICPAGGLEFGCGPFANATNTTLFCGCSTTMAIPPGFSLCSGGLSTLFRICLGPVITRFCGCTSRELGVVPQCGDGVPNVDITCPVVNSARVICNGTQGIQGRPGTNASNTLQS